MKNRQNSIKTGNSHPHYYMDLRLQHHTIAQTEKFIFKLSTFILTFLLLISTSGCRKQYKNSKFLLNTIVDITVVDKKESARSAIAQAFNEIERIDNLLSVYKNSSEVSKINMQSGISDVRVSADTLDIIEKSIAISEMTNGAFDITVGPLVELWGFKDSNKHVPSDKDIVAKKQLVGYKNITIDHARSSVRLDLQGMQLDLGAIAVGFAVDKAIEKLKLIGIKDALINAGGEIYALGTPHGRKAWRIGIQHPRRSSELIGILELKDKAISTSGDYENYFEVNGKRYSHILSPYTGKPVNGIMSVTVVSEKTVIADALSTAIFPMGAEKGMELIESLNDVECIIITGESEKDMKIMISKGLRDKVQIINGGN